VGRPEHIYTSLPFERKKVTSGVTGRLHSKRRGRKKKKVRKRKGKVTVLSIDRYRRLLASKERWTREAETRGAWHTPKVDQQWGKRKKKTGTMNHGKGRVNVTNGQEWKRQETCTSRGREGSKKGGATRLWVTGTTPKNSGKTHCKEKTTGSVLAPVWKRNKRGKGSGPGRRGSDNGPKPSFA